MGITCRLRVTVRTGILPHNRPIKLMFGDITYVRAREGRLHLAVVIGLSSRQAVGWSMAGPIPTGHLWPLVTSAGIVSERCVTEGDLETQTPERPAPARRPWQSICSDQSSQNNKTFRHSAKHGPERKLLGEPAPWVQCGCRKLFSRLKNRTDTPSNLP